MAKAALVPSVFVDESHEARGFFEACRFRSTGILSSPAPLPAAGLSGANLSACVGSDSGRELR